MNSLVDDEMQRGEERFPTVRTGVKLPPGVDPFVGDKMGMDLEAFPAG